LEAGACEHRYAKSLNPDDPAALSRNLTRARKCLARAALTCPSNLTWRVWVSGALMEADAGQEATARTLLRRAYATVPEKSRASVFVEAANAEETLGNLDVASAILTVARSEVSSDWKVWLEAVEFERRCSPNDSERARSLARAAIEMHNSTGRIWALVVAMETDPEQQAELLRRALENVPKSGEVWCEAARVHLDPTSQAFDLGTVQRFLDFATQFTPQFGDSFLECLRLKLILEVKDKFCVALLERLRELVGASEFDVAPDRATLREQRGVSERASERSAP
jgi:la-related protein 1